MKLQSRTILLLASASVFAVSEALAQRPIPAGSVRNGSLSFDGHSTLGDFTGTTTTVTGEMTGAATLASVRGWVEAPVKSLVTGNSHRDRDLNKSMESDQFPTLRFELAEVVPGEAKGDSVAVTLHGSFLIHGVKQPAVVPATVVLLRDGVRVRGAVSLSLQAFKIGGLSKMLGLLKMHDTILVHLDLSFEASPLP